MQKQKVDYNNKNILIQGLGLNDGGVGMVEFLHSRGAFITITDLRTADILEKSIKAINHIDNINYVFGEHREIDFQNCDILIKNPAVPFNNHFVQIAKKSGAEILTEMDIAFREINVPIIGITGTKGKSTTTSLTAHIFKTAGKKIFLGGNIGISIVRNLDTINDYDYVILELSDVNLQSFNSPVFHLDTAVITNIYKDHLNQYNSYQDYIDTKKNIYKYLDKHDNLILNIDSEIIESFYKEITNTTVTTLSTTKQKADIYIDLEEKIIKYKNNDLVIPTNALIGQHNIYNIALASTISIINGIDQVKIIDAIKSYEPLKGRMQLVRELEGVKYINDTNCTNVESLIAAVNTFSNGENIILIAGGMDKKLDWHEITPGIKNKVKSIILLEGTGSVMMFENTKQLNVPIYKYFNNLPEAILKAKSIAKSGDVVLMSPCCSSFNMFKNQYERGDIFIETVENFE